MLDPSRLTRKDFLRAGLVSAAGVYAGACQREESAAVAVPAAPGAAMADTMPGAGPRPAGLDTTFVGPKWAGDVVNLKYSNPFEQAIKIAWYDGKQVAHLFLGAAGAKPDFKVAEQYLPLPESEFKGAQITPDQFKDLTKKLVGHGIFDSVPGEPNYSPIWHNNWVLVPAGYQENTLKSVADAKASGYRIVSTPIWVN